MFIVTEYAALTCATDNFEKKKKIFSFFLKMHKNLSYIEFRGVLCF